MKHFLNRLQRKPQISPLLRFFLLRTVLAVTLPTATAVATAQQIGQNKPAGDTQPYTVSVKSQLVVETVVVKDKQGKFIPGLTAKDFTLTEDGAPQTIRFCEHQALTENAAPVPVAKPGSEEIKLYKQLTRTQLSPEDAESDPLSKSPAACSVLRHVCHAPG